MIWRQVGAVSTRRALRLWHSVWASYSHVGFFMFTGFYSDSSSARRFGQRIAKKARERHAFFERLEERTVFAAAIGVNFQGSSLFTDSLSIPPDTNGAIGPSHFVELINGRYSVYNRATGAKVQTSTLDQFWLNAGISSGEATGSFDPRIIFDGYSSRWIAVAVANAGSAASNVQLAISNSSDPTTGWDGFSIDADATDNYWADFPTLGLDANGVYVSANMFPIAGGTFNTVTILSFPKYALLQSPPTIINHTKFALESTTDRGISVQPAVALWNSADPAPLLAADNASSADRLNRTNITNGSSSSPTLSTSIDIIVDPYTNPPTADQPGTAANLHTGDRRLSATVYQMGGILWAVHSVNVDNRSAIRWYRIDKATNTVLQSGTIADANLSFYFPSIAANTSGEVVIGFSGSSSTQFPSAYAIAGTTSGGVTTFGSPMLLKAGVSDYQITDPLGRNRWGDYSATTVDPNDSRRFWTIQEYVSATDMWSTYIAEIAFNIGTEVKVDLQGDLKITDVEPSGKNDDLTISFDPVSNEYVIADPTAVLTTAIPGASGHGTHTIRVPLAVVTGDQIWVTTFDGDDRLVVQTPGITKEVVYNAGDGTDSIVFNGYTDWISLITTREVVTGRFEAGITIGSNVLHISSNDMEQIGALGQNQGIQLILPETPSGVLDPTFFVRDDSEAVLGRSEIAGNYTPKLTFSNPTTSLKIGLTHSLVPNQLLIGDMDADFNPAGTFPDEASIFINSSNGDDHYTVQSVRRTNGLAYNTLLIRGGAGNDVLTVDAVDAVMGQLTFEGQDGIDLLTIGDGSSAKYYKMLFSNSPSPSRLNRADTLTDFNSGVFNRDLRFVDVESTSLDSGGGADRLDMYGISAVAESFVLGGTYSAEVTRNGGQITFRASSVEEVRALSHLTLGGGDSVVLNGSVGNDTLTAYFDHGTMTGGVNFQYSGFKHVSAYANGGIDTTNFVPTADNDKLINNVDGSPTQATVTASVGFYFGNTNTTLYGDNSSFLSDAIARGFTSVYANAYTGLAPNAWDKAYITGTTGNDYFETKNEGTWNRYSYMTDAAANIVHVRNFGFVDAYASTGYDTAGFYDTASDWDFLEVPTWDTSKIYLNSQIGKYLNWATGFDLVNVYTTGYDSGKNDRRNTSFSFVNVVTPSHWDIV